MFSTESRTSPTARALLEGLMPPARERRSEGLDVRIATSALSMPLRPSSNLTRLDVLRLHTL
jgi:hypothetical protein